LRVPADYRPPRRRHSIVVLVRQVHAGVLEALAYARSIAPDDLRAMTVVVDADEAERIEKQWYAHNITVPLEIVISANEDFTDATIAYVDELNLRSDNTIVTVLIPELFVRHWWQQVLHNQSALLLKGRLLFRKRVVVTSLPYRVD
jgi:hypothetical protein